MDIGRQVEGDALQAVSVKARAFKRTDLKQIINRDRD